MGPPVPGCFSFPFETCLHPPRAVVTQQAEEGLGGLACHVPVRTFHLGTTGQAHSTLEFPVIFFSIMFLFRELA